MAYKRRSPERIEEIDSFLEEHYEKHGAKYCSDALNELKGYIFNRASALGIKYENSEKFRTNVNRSSKLERNNKRIAELMNINERLRKENMKIIHENMKMKKALESDSKIIKL